jgi:hypothetical protein
MNEDMVMGKVDRVTLVTLRWFAMGLLLMGLVPLTGCRICPDCEDIAYPAYGGSWQRTRRNSGRVGSIFDPGGAKTSDLVPRDDPADTDVLERLRQQGRVPRVPDPEDLRGDDADTEPGGKDPRDDLRDRGLDDIDDDNGDELRNKDLRDIEVKVIPGNQVPPLLR